MNPLPQQHLGPDEIAKLSSKYIDAGVKQESWRIKSVDVEGPHLRAEICMERTFVSPTDPGGFHLTIFATQEFLAQLSNIYLHLLAGSTVKNRETWMRESAITARSAIRDRNKILVEMHFFSVRKVRNTVYAKANCKVFDEGGGSFTAKLAGIMS
jgi:hypothetical protein